MSFSSRKKSVLRQKQLRFESLENRELLSINPTILGDFGINAVAEDRFEPNDSIAEVAQCVAGATDSPNLGKITGTTVLENLSITEGNEDWFRFELTTIGEAGNYVSIESTEGDLDLFLYDGNGNVVDSSNFLGSNESITLEGLFSGVYYVCIFDYDEAEVSDYTLTIVTPDSSAPGSVTSGLYGDTLFIQGTADADWVEIEETATQIIVHTFSANRQTELNSQDFAKDDIAVIRFNGDDGDDTFTNSYNGAVGFIDCYLEGNDGDDFLVGGKGNDTIYGGAGNDILDGGTGNNILVGGSGANTFYASGVGSSVYAWTGTGDQWASGYDTRSDDDAHLIFGITDRFGNTSDNFYGATLDYVPWTDSDIADVLSIVSGIYDYTGSYKYFQNTYFADKSVYLVLSDNYEGLGSVYGYNGYGVDVLFRANAVNSRLTIHEFGHFWDDANSNPFFEEFKSISYNDDGTMKDDAVDGDFAFGIMSSIADAPWEDWAYSISLVFDGFDSYVPDPTDKWYQKVEIINRFAEWLAVSVETPTSFNDNDFQKLYAADLIDADGNTLQGTITWSDDAEKRVTAINASGAGLSGDLDLSGCTALTSLDLQYNGLTSLDVSDCTALTYLNCKVNPLASLDVSSNTALTFLSCYHNGLTSLDVSNNTALTYLDCEDNQLTSLDVSQNTALTELYCYDNQLTSLDVSQNTALTDFSCSWNNLTSLDVSTNTALTDLNCGGNNLTELDVSANTALTSLDCRDNQLTFDSLVLPAGYAGTLSAYQSVDLGESISRVDFDGLAAYINSETEYHWYDEYDNLVDANLIAESGGVFDFDVSLAGKTLYCVMTNSAVPGMLITTTRTEIDFAGIPDAGDTLATATAVTFTDGTFTTTERIGDGSYGTKDVDFFELTVTEADLNKGYAFTTAAVTGGSNVDTYIRLFDADGNLLTYNDDGGDGNYSSLTFIPSEAGTYYLGVSSYGNRNYDPNTPASGSGGSTGDYSLTVNIANLNADDLAKVTAAGLEDYATWTIIGDELRLTRISAYNANLTGDLDLSGCTALEYLYCAANQLTSLDVSGCTALTSLDCGSNQLTSLDISTNTALTSLECYNNQLTSLNVSGCTALTSLNCGSNQLTSLDIFTNTALTTLYCSNNELTSLDVSNLATLMNLDCGNNSLTSLDVSANLAITYLSCYDNKLTFDSLTLPAGYSGYLNAVQTLQVGTQVGDFYEISRVDFDELASYAGPNVTYVWYISSNSAPIDSDLIVETNDVFTFDESLAGKTVYCVLYHATSLVTLRADVVIDYAGIVDVGDTIGTATAVTFTDGVFTTNERIGDGSYGTKDVDFFEFTVTAADLNKGYAFTTAAVAGGTDVDTYIQLFDANGNQLDYDDDDGDGSYSSLTFIPPEAGTYYLGVSSWGNRNYDPNTPASGSGGATGDYSLTVNVTNFNADDLAKVTAAGLEDYATWTIIGDEYRLTEINAYSANLTGDLDLSGCTALTSLSCGYNQLTSLDVSGCTALQDVSCYSNQLTSLDVSSCTALQYVHCSYNLLTFDSLTLPAGYNGYFSGTQYVEVGQLRADGYSYEIPRTGFDELAQFAGPNTIYDWTVFNTQNGIWETIDPDLITETGGVFTFDDSLAGKMVNCVVSRADSDLTIEMDYELYLSIAGLEYNAREKELVDNQGLTEYAVWEYIGNELRLTEISAGDSGLSGEIDLSGCTELIFVSVSSNSLTSLDISGCTAMEFLFCYNNQLTSLDVSTNTGLAFLSCYNNQLTSLDVSANTALTSLYCNNNQLTSLDVSGCTAMEFLFCYNNQLTSLDVSANTALEYLSCYNNQLTSLDVSANTALEHLSCYNNQLTSLDVSANTALTYVDVDDNRLTFDSLVLPVDYTGWVYASQNIEISETISRVDFDELAAYYKTDGSTTYTWFVSNSEYGSYSEVASSLITETNGRFDFDESLAGKWAYCVLTNSGSSVELKTDAADIDYAGMNFNSHDWEKVSSQGLEAYAQWSLYADEFCLTGIAAPHSGLTGTLDLSGCQYLRVIDLYSNDLSVLNVSNCTALKTVSCAGNQLTSLILTGSTAIDNIICYDNKLTSLDLTGLTLLESLDCERNSLTSLDMTPCTRLEYLECGSNQLTSLNVTGRTALSDLRCYDNKLTSLNLTGCTLLENLDCSNNQLTSLNLSANTALTSLYCYSNQLTSLNVSGCTALAFLSCGGNQLTSLDLSACTSLNLLDVSGGLLSYANVTLPAGFSGNVFNYSYELGDGEIPDTNFDGLQSLHDFGGGNTSYIWYVYPSYIDPDDYSPATEVDPQLITNNNGVFTFDGSLAGKRVYCVVRNDAYPDWSITTETVNVVSSAIAYNAREKAIVDSVKAYANFDHEWVYDSVSNEMRLYYFELWNIDTPIGALDFSGSTHLAGLHLYNVGLETLNVSGCTALEMLYCDNNNLTSLNVTGCTALYELNCSMNQLASLDISTCTELEYFACMGNQLSSMDFSNNTRLESLYLGGEYYVGMPASIQAGNNFTSLDLSALTALESLNVAYNRLTSLDLSSNLNLRSLDCYENQLTSLDLSANTLLYSVDCYNNQLETLIVPYMGNGELICYGNKLKFSTLPSPGTAQYYSYADNYEGITQAPVSITNDNGLVDLSSEYSVDGVLTSYAWYYENGDAVDSSLISSPSNGVFQFDSSLDGNRLYCEMTNSAFADLVLQTTLVYVGDEVGEAPINFRTTVVGRENISFDWNDSDGAESYLVERYDALGNLEATLSVDESAFVDTGLTAGTEYTYRLRAIYADGASPVAELTVTTATPEEADALMITNVDVVKDANDNVTQVTVTWAEIEGATSSVLFVNGRPVVIEDGQTSYVNNTPGTKDTYVVYSFVDGRWLFTTPYIVTGQPLPKITSHEFTEGGLKLNWENTGTDYVVFRDGRPIGNATSETSVVDAGVRENTEYKYILYSYSPTTGWVYSQTYVVTIPETVTNLSLFESVWSDENLTGLEDLTLV